MMEFKFRPAKNGLILEAKVFEGETEEIVYQEETSGEDHEIETFADFLSLLTDYYGPGTSRYSEKRIRVVIVPGDKFEGRIAATAANEDLAYYLEHNAGADLKEAFLAGWDAAKHDY